MRIIYLMQVESSLDGSVRTDSSRMSLSSSYNGISFTINYSRFIGEFTFLAFAQTRLTRVDFHLSLRAMVLKTYLLVFPNTSVAVWVRNCMRLCVGCANFAHVCVQLCEI